MDVAVKYEGSVWQVAMQMISSTCTEFDTTIVHERIKQHL